MYKDPFQSLLGEELQFVRRGKDHKRRTQHGKKGKRKQYYLSYNIEAVGKNIRWEKGKEIFERKSRFESWSGEEYQVDGNFIHPCGKEFVVEAQHHVEEAALVGGEGQEEG